MAARIPAAAGSLALAVESQHWTGPVLHDPAAGLSFGVGVATARIARVENAKSLENMTDEMKQGRATGGENW